MASQGWALPGAISGTEGLRLLFLLFGTASSKRERGNSEL